MHATVDAFVDSTRALVEAVATAGGEALGTLPTPVPTSVTRMLVSLRGLVDQMPPLTAEIDVVVRELHAKRLSIEALQAELATLDEQLEILERSLRPVVAWSRQWNRLRRSLTDALPTGEGTGPAD
ncbi:hypothetical protein [Nocardioides panaciterrulae]|uniref:Uncharacterized protein n=1 Tax=Nocardioides panaciterrulae TaxID=661492 RepID=A0A7Y9J9S0_9ACTN|nr:hypothetical protein [Nocardioides panaciterrulae]NYD40930.1 hypothetical protein [Nocardioides panaciterrulae]